MALTFVVGTAADVFAPAVATRIDHELRARFPLLQTGDAADAYRSEDVPPSGWGALQKRVAAAIGAQKATQVTKMDAYQAVYVPSPFANIEQVMIPPAADPLQVGSLDELLRELREFAMVVRLPTDDVELMSLAARYLEDENAAHTDADVQTFVQLMLSAKQAAARSQPLWIAT